MCDTASIISTRSTAIPPHKWLHNNLKLAYIQPLTTLCYSPSPSPSPPPSRKFPLQRGALSNQSLLEFASAPRFGCLRIAWRQTRAVPHLETSGALVARPARCLLGSSFESSLHSFDFNFLIHAVILNFAARIHPHNCPSRTTNRQAAYKRSRNIPGSDRSAF
jgi:hypothetical protein